jgi:hypothetical protein
VRSPLHGAHLDHTTAIWRSRLCSRSHGITFAARSCTIARYAHRRRIDPRCGPAIRGAERARGLISFDLRYPFQHLLDHHLYPHVPGHHLPTLHHHLRPALLERGAPVFDNCLAVTLAALRAGPAIVDDDVALVSLRRRST